jgi:choline dehydrogenase-like flavoprotein
VFILAGGAVENARLLMLSGIGSQSAGGGWLGRCFMEHPRDGSLRLVPLDPDVIDSAAFYDMRRAPDGTIVGGRLAPRNDIPSTGNEPNFSVTLLPQPPASGLARRLLERLGIDRAHRGYGWSRSPQPSREYQHLGLLVNLEQFPSLDNRVDLSSVRDRLGYPRAHLYLNWRQAEQQAVDQIAERIDLALSQAGLGNLERLISAPVDLNAHHHAGTTRMGRSEQDGVVDTDCRVFGADDIYVAGASVFPTAGYANPVLTIVALAIRLADHIKLRL